MARKAKKERKVKERKVKERKANAKYWEERTGGSLPSHLLACPVQRREKKTPIHISLHYPMRRSLQGCLL